MKRGFVVLAVLLVVIGLPILIPSMDAAHYIECGSALAASPLCLLAVLVGTGIAFALAFGYVREQAQRCLELLLAVFVERQPQMSSA